MSNAKSRAGSPFAASAFLFVLVGCGLMFLYSTFGWPLWKILIVGLGVALFAAAVCYVVGKRHRRS